MNSDDKRYLRAVSANDPLEPLDDLEEFLDDSATYGASGLREELTEPDSKQQEIPEMGPNKRP